MHTWQPQRFIRTVTTRPWLALATGLLLWVVLHLHIYPRDLYGIHAWRQTQTQTVINNFGRENWNLFQPRYKAPADGNRTVRMEVPLMQWVFAGVQKTVGGGVTTSRILSSLLFMLTVVGMYRCGLRVFGQPLPALLTAWAVLWSPVMFYYGVCPLPDNAALCCGVWMLAYTFRFLHSLGVVHAVCAALLLGLAAAIKLPFVLLGAALLPLLFSRRVRIGARLRLAVLFALSLLPAALWYAWVIPTWEGNGVVAGALQHRPTLNEAAGILSHYLISAGPELFINYGALLPFLAGLFQAISKRFWKSLRGAMLLSGFSAVVAYFLFELKLIGREHDYYLFPFLPFIALTVGYGAAWCLRHHRKALQWVCALGLVVMPLAATLRARSRFSLQNPEIARALLFDKATLQGLIPHTTRVVVAGDPSGFIVLYHLDRKGWTYPTTNFPPQNLLLHQQAGARFLVVANDEVLGAELGNTVATPLYDSLDLRVYPL